MRVLWLKTELLHPIDKGGRIRTYQMLKHLKREHQVTYLCLVGHDHDPRAVDQADEYCHRLITIPWTAPDKYSPLFYGDLALNVISSLPYAIEKYQSAKMARAIRREAPAHDVVVCDFLAASSNVPRRLSRPTVLFQHNVESVIWQRHYEAAQTKVRKAYFYAQWLKMRRYEAQACRRFDAVIGVSPNDARIFRDQYGARSVHDVPTGVDTEFFHPLDTPVEAARLVFTGSMDWLPNEDAMMFFAERILPAIHRQVPGAKLTIVGRSPTPKLVQLAQENPFIELTGRVDDIRPYLDSAAVYIVPLRIGGGTRLKIYEAMAMQKPVVSTTVGAEGLPVKDGKELLLADEPEAFARAVVDLINDPQRARDIGKQARDAVVQQFGWNQASDTFARVCEGLVRQPDRAPTAASSSPRFTRRSA